MKTLQEFYEEMIKLNKEEASTFSNHKFMIYEKEYNLSKEFIAFVNEAIIKEKAGEEEYNLDIPMYCVKHYDENEDLYRDKIEIKLPDGDKFVMNIDSVSPEKNFYNFLTKVKNSNDIQNIEGIEKYKIIQDIYDDIQYIEDPKTKKDNIIEKLKNLNDSLSYYDCEGVINVIYPLLDDELKNDPEIIKLCIEKYPEEDMKEFFNLVPKELSYDEDILEKFIMHTDIYYSSYSNYILNEISDQMPELLNNEKIIDACIKRYEYEMGEYEDNGEIYFLLPKELRENPKIINITIEKTNDILYFSENMNDDFKKDPEFVASLIMQVPDKANQILTECNLPEDTIKALKEMPEIQEIIEKEKQKESEGIDLND